MSATTPDRNLLFGLLALQMDLISREQLLDAMHAWMARKGDPLGQLFLERSALTEVERHAVERLVEVHAARHGGAHQSLAGLRVEAPLREALSQLAGGATLPPDGPSVSPPPRLASRYRKLRLHAKGGLGEVHVALDEELKREVALKEIQPQLDYRPDFRWRFVREAEVTGHLEHPGIVPVYGLETDADGRPRYAMRFIKGEPLHDAIVRFHRADEGRRDPGERELSFRALLARFVAVCQAVAYAHSRGVVHRDLKPSNVMLGEYGETLVVDWGLAKTYDVPEHLTPADRPVPTSASGSTPTEMGNAVGTPAFMPPEQARGEHDRVDHRSDVFALGATLYNLLTGQPPYAGGIVSLLAHASQALFQPVRHVNRRVPAALEAVCHKAMALRPEERYGSARQLAADVERWLADEPVEAMPEPWREKARRWARRNRALVASSLVLLVASVVGLGVGLTAVRAEERKTAGERDRAVKAEGVASQRLQQVEKAEAEARANLVTARANLTRAEINDRLARGHLQRAGENFRLARQAVDDCYGLAKNDPLLQGPDLTPELRAVRRKLLEKALPFYQNFRAQRPGDEGAGHDLFAQHHHAGSILFELGRYSEALGHFHRAGNVLAAIIKGKPSSLRPHQDMAINLSNIALCLVYLGRQAEAIQFSAMAIGIHRLMVKERPKVVAHQFDLAHALNNLGVGQTVLARHEDARSSFSESVALYRAAFKEGAKEAPRRRADLAATLGNLGRTYGWLAQPREALRCFTEALDLDRALVREQPQSPWYQAGLASTLASLGNLHAEQGRGKEALAAFVEAEGLYRALNRAQRDVPRFREGLARVLIGRGDELSKSRQLTQALDCYTEAVSLRRQMVQAQARRADNQVLLATALKRLGQLHVSESREAEAVACHSEAVAIYRALLQRQPGDRGYRIELASALTEEGTALRFHGRGAEALQRYTEAADLSRGLMASEPQQSSHRIDLYRALLLRALYLRQAGRLEEARRDLDDSLHTLAVIRPDHPDHAVAQTSRFRTHHQRARVLTGLGQYKRAMPDWDRAVQLAPKQDLPDVFLGRAHCLARDGQHGRAASLVAGHLRLKSLPRAMNYDVAAVLALSAAGAARDDRMPLPLRERRTEARASWAVILLRRAAERGYFDSAERVERLAKDRDFDFLRRRADFRQVVAQLRRGDRGPSVP